MKTIEVVLPCISVQATVQKLQMLDVRAINVEAIKDFKQGLHRTMIHRGCVYEESFDIESKLQFNVSDEHAADAETIVAGVAC